MTGRVYRSSRSGGGDQPDPPAPPAGAGVAGHSATMAVLSLVSRGTGFLRTAAVVAAVGALTVGDAYGTAQFFPAMIYEFLLGGILSSVLVPVLVRRRRADADGGQEYAQRLLSLAVLALGAATVLAVVAAPLLTAVFAGAGSGEQFRRVVTLLSYLMLPMMFFSGLSALFTAILNTRGHFAAPTWAPILNNLVVIVTAGLFYAAYGPGRPELTDMSAGPVLLLGGGTLLGVAVQAAGMWPALRRVGFGWRWRGEFRKLELSELGRLGAWMFCYVAVSQVGVLVLLRLLNSAASEPGGAAGVMIYNNAYLLMMMAHGIVAVSLITALLPRMSAAAADFRLTDLAADLSRGVRTATAVLAPVVVVFGVLALPIAVTLFEHGAVEAAESRRLADVLVVAAVALIPFALSQLFTFAFYALPDTRTPALVNIPVVALRVLVQVALFYALGSALTAVGVMVGNAVSYVAAAVVSATLLRGRIGRIGLRGIVTTFAKITVAAGGAGLAGWLVTGLLPGGENLSGGQAVSHLALGGVVIGGAYLGLARLLRLREIDEVLGLVVRKLRR
ncbi:lipid II flippase MurJ [Pilimelia terevasa]|uniref:Lipid II flippase MurJ n=1 Tax=Pilimelia terevasa TaxID=53372 RepID=A0A8J3BV12_9ACTN|nr:murein biosynthesis integral membrane protein MurJ [Pilimelia terevasa]GGK41429.1 lipid II flippase MurJ [Pilimelia terevasa]